MDLEKTQPGDERHERMSRFERTVMSAMKDAAAEYSITGHELLAVLGQVSGDAVFFAAKHGVPLEQAMNILLTNLDAALAVKSGAVSADELPKTTRGKKYDA